MHWGFAQLQEEGMDTSLRAPGRMLGAKLAAALPQVASALCSGLHLLAKLIMLAERFVVASLLSNLDFLNDGFDVIEKRAPSCS